MQDRRGADRGGEGEGIALTRDEAEAYMADIADFELDDATLSDAAGGKWGRSYGAARYKHLS